jgi:transcriptional regulator
VHARGGPRLIDEPGLRAILDDMLERVDATGWRLQRPEEFVRARLGAIAGFEIALEHLEGKWKISQNRSVADQRRVVDWLERGDAQSRALAVLMRTRLEPEFP